MSSSAARQRQHYRRSRAGRAVFAIEADVIGIEELVTAAGLLPANVDDHHSVEAALGRLLELLIADHRQAVGQS
jgi:hypothetical protein